LLLFRSQPAAAYAKVAAAYIQAAAAYAQAQADYARCVRIILNSAELS
jgi:hypothetical protein